MVLRPAGSCNASIQGVWIVQGRSKKPNGAEKQAESGQVLTAQPLTPRDVDVLRSFFDRIVALRREQRQLGSEISEIYKEAKSLGYSNASMRDALKLAEMDPAEAAMRLELDQTYYTIARGGAVSHKAAADVVPLNESPAWLKGRADALAGVPFDRNAVPYEQQLDYELGHIRGVELRDEAAAAQDPIVRKPVRKRVSRGVHLGDRQAAAVKRAKRKGGARPAA